MKLKLNIYISPEGNNFTVVKTIMRLNFVCCFFVVQLKRLIICFFSTKLQCTISTKKWFNIMESEQKYEAKTTKIKTKLWKHENVWVWTLHTYANVFNFDAMKNTLLWCLLSSVTLYIKMRKKKIQTYFHSTVFSEHVIHVFRYCFCICVLNMLRCWSSSQLHTLDNKHM